MHTAKHWHLENYDTNMPARQDLILQITEVHPGHRLSQENSVSWQDDDSGLKDFYEGGPLCSWQKAALSPGDKKRRTEKNELR